MNGLFLGLNFGANLIPESLALLPPGLCAPNARPGNRQVLSSATLDVKCSTFTSPTAGLHVVSGFQGFTKLPTLVDYPYANV